MQRKKYEDLKKVFGKQTKKSLLKFIDKWRVGVPINSDIFYIFARALYDDDRKVNNEVLNKSESIDILFKRIDFQYCEYVKEAREELNEEELKSIILYFYDADNFNTKNITMPEEIIKLTYELLDLKEEDQVLQPYIMNGTFMTDYLTKYPNGNYIGVDINTENILISEIKASVAVESYNQVKLIQENYINVDLDKINYNKVISFPPMGVNNKYLFDILEDKKIIELYDDNKFLPKYNDWINILKLVQNEKFERGIFIVTSGLLFKDMDKSIKKYLIQKGLIEGIIEMPSNLFRGTTIATNILVLSKNNTKIKMVDASELYENRRPVNIIDDNNLNLILKSYTDIKDNSKIVSVEEIENNNYNLLPRRYTNKDLDLEKFVYLKDVANIKRGYANFKQKEINSRLSEEETNIKLLNAKDINDDFEIGKLSSLKNIELKEEVYCANYEDILVARGGTYKSILLNKNFNEKLIVNGTMYIITCDKNKINPYYLQMYMSSEHCLKQIESLNAGTSIQFISIKQLGELKIPKVSKRTEEEIAGKYKNILNKYEIIKLQKKSLIEETKDLVSEVL